MELGTQIKKYRQELQISQEELADRVYVSRQTISNWENDKGKGVCQGTWWGTFYGL